MTSIIIDSLQEIHQVGSELGIKPFVIRDKELESQGFGGIYGVGKASINPPALAVLSHKPKVGIYLIQEFLISIRNCYFQKSVERCQLAFLYG